MLMFAALQRRASGGIGIRAGLKIRVIYGFESRLAHGLHPTTGWSFCLQREPLQESRKCRKR